MLRHSFNLETEAQSIESAVKSVLEAGKRTRDIAKPSEKAIGTAEMGIAVLERLK